MEYLAEGHGKERRKGGGGGWRKGIMRKGGWRRGKRRLNECVLPFSSPPSSLPPFI
jgi:hypothetical protein